MLCVVMWAWEYSHGMLGAHIESKSYQGYMCMVNIMEAQHYVRYACFIQLLFLLIPLRFDWCVVK